MTLDSFEEALSPDVTPPVRNISNSEVTTFLSCKLQYDFAFMRNLAPKETPTPLARGSVGHLAFEYYWTARLEGASHDRAFERGYEAFATSIREKTFSLDAIMHAQSLWQRYMIAHAGLYTHRWKPLGTEQRYDLPLTSTLNFPIRYDLYLEDMETGKRYILDYKYTYDFWSNEDHDLNGQMPKYVAVLQANGHRVDGGYLEEIRTRKLGPDKSRESKNLWRRTPYVPSIAKKRFVLRQHVAASLEIERHRNLSPEERVNVSLPVLNKHGACKYCNFKDLCNATLEGKEDLSVDIRVGYTTNTYGYNDNTDIGELGR